MEKDNKGYYLIEGEKYISVTTVLSYIDKPGLRYWYGKYGTAECNKIKAQSAEIGTTIHALVARNIVGGKVLKKDLKKKEVKTGYESYLKFKSEFKVPEDRSTIIDFKTSDYYDKAFELQLAAYSLAVPVNSIAIGWNTEVTVVNTLDKYAGTADAIYVPEEPTVTELMIVQLGKKEVGYKTSIISYPPKILELYKSFRYLKMFVWASLE